MGFFFPKDAGMDSTAGTQYLIGEHFIYLQEAYLLFTTATETPAPCCPQKARQYEILTVILRTTSNQV